MISVFATGAAAAARLKAEAPGLRTVVLCTDVAVHRMWVAEGTDLFLVTSAAAAASVRRYLPRAPVAVVPPPVRAAFYAAPPPAGQGGAGRPGGRVLRAGHRQRLGLRPAGRRACPRWPKRACTCWPWPGRDAAVERRFRELAARTHRITPFGFTERVPELMAAADLVIALPGATTCSEARVVGRQLLLLDVMPGHGRDNLLHELELGKPRRASRPRAAAWSTACSRCGTEVAGQAPGPATRRRAGSPPTRRRCAGSAWTWCRRVRHGAGRSDRTAGRDPIDR